MSLAALWRRLTRTKVPSSTCLSLSFWPSVWWSPREIFHKSPSSKKQFPFCIISSTKEVPQQVSDERKDSRAKDQLAKRLTVVAELSSVVKHPGSSSSWSIDMFSSSLTSLLSNVSSPWIEFCHAERGTQQPKNEKWGSPFDDGVHKRRNYWPWMMEAISRHRASLA